MANEPVNSKNDPNEQAAELRRQAEDILRERIAQDADAHENLAPAETRKILHELRVHQIELEIQNEELRCAQTELVIARDRYFDFYNLAPVGYLTLSGNGLIFEVNLTCTILLGFARTDLFKQSMSRFILPEDHNIFYSTRKNVLTAGEPQVCDLRMVKKDGTVFWACLTFTAAQDASGSFLYRIVLTDITERKQAENALRESEERLEFVLRGSRLGFWDWDLETNDVKRNERWAEMLGYTLREIDFTVKHWLDFVHPDDRSMAHQSVQDHLEGRTPMHQAEYRMFAKDGRHRWILDQAQVVKRDAHGRPLRMSGTHTDITERKQAEESLRKSEAHLRTLVQTIPDLIWLKDKDGVYLSCNKIFGRLLGAGEEDIVGKTDYDFINRELADYYRAHEQRVIAEGRQSRKEEWVTFLDDGHRALLETVNTPMYDDKGTLVGVLGIGRDITERKRSEAALQHYAFLMKEMGKAAKIGGWEFDAATGKGTWTEEVALIHEVDPQEAASVETVISFYPEESKEKITKAIQDAIESGKSYVLELELITAKGNNKWVKTIGYPIIEMDIARAHVGEIQLLMTDVVMPGINGRALAESIVRINPDLKCLFMSGYTSEIIAQQGILNEGVHFIQKPFNMLDLAAKIREALS